MNTQEFNEQIAQKSAWVSAVKQEMAKVVVGQQKLVNRLILSLLCKGHVLLEGVPGLAKTLSVKALAGTMQAAFSRIQFTPDLLPADLLGTMIYNPEERQFTAKKGPVFANLILADEINRAPAKVQSALLEAMQERQVTLGECSYPLPNPFLVLATQNPIEQEGTYQLPEAQLDRFLFKVVVDYPSRDEELKVLEMMSSTMATTTMACRNLTTHFPRSKCTYHTSCDR
jgi:MoxR-like ATPase